jgi:predicted ATP-dependent endonuclease of OLD family
MYIKRLYLENIRCFDKFEINFDQPGSSILLLGDNGDGKSTILKSLAMGLCDESSTAALFRELPGEFVRRTKRQEEVPTGEFGFVEVDIGSRRGVTYRIKTKITSLKRFERISQRLYIIKGNNKPKLLKQEKFPWEKIFVSGYGPGVRIQATSDSQHYLPVDAVYPLFSYSSPLQNPELVISRLLFAARSDTKTLKESRAKEKQVLLIIKRLMYELLDLESPDHFKFTTTGIKVDGHWGTSELSELGDGYQAVINWVLDLLSWWFLSENAKSEMDLESLRGIVIIDEIEQHLHPKWQRRIFSRLKEKFPNIQFIVATHSPLVASSNKDVDVHLLSRGKQKILNPFGWLAEDMYEEMGLNSSRSKDFEVHILNRYKELQRKKIDITNFSQKDAKELRTINESFSKMPESDPIGLSLEIQSITESLKHLRAKKNKGEKSEKRNS